MPEVLKLEYHASTAMLLVELDATHTCAADGAPRVLAGVPTPVHAWKLSDLEVKHPKIGADIRDIIAQLHDVTRDELEAGTMTPEKLREEHNRLAHAKAAFAKTTKFHEDRQAALVADAEAKRKELDELTRQHEELKAAHAALAPSSSAGAPATDPTTATV